MLVPHDRPDLDALAARAVADPQAQEELLERLRPLTYGVAARGLRQLPRLGLQGLLDHDDLLQQCRELLLYLMRGYRPGAGSALPYFAFRLPSKLIQHLRREARRPAGKRVCFDDPVVQADVEALGVQDLDPDLGCGTEVERVLRSLRPGQRALLELAYWHHQTDQQIAVRLGKNPFSVRQARYRALRTMKERLAGAMLAA